MGLSLRWFFQGNRDEEQVGFSGLCEVFTGFWPQGLALCQYWIHDICIRSGSLRGREAPEFLSVGDLWSVFRVLNHSPFRRVTGYRCYITGQLILVRHLTSGKTHIAFKTSLFHEFIFININLVFFILASKWSTFVEKKSASSNYYNYCNESWHYLPQPSVSGATERRDNHVLMLSHPTQWVRGGWAFLVLYGIKESWQWRKRFN